MQIIGIDIGTTSICGIAMDTELGVVLRSKTVNSYAFIEGNKPFEKLQSPEKIISLAKEILDSLICKETVAVGVTGQMHGIVYTDKNGKAISPLYTWQDERGNQQYKGTTYAEYLGSFSGYGNVTDFYNCENGLRPQEAIAYCTIHDYFVMQLCGLKRPLIHASDAASFGLYDLQNNRFDYEVNADIVTDYCIAGTYQNIPVSIAVGDNQASVFSTLADEENVLLNVGTGSQVSIISDHIVESDNIETRPYFENKFLVVGAALCGGRAYSILKDFYAQILGYVTEVTEEQVYAIMSRMLSSIENTSLKVDTRFAGTRKNAHITGSITGITTENFTPAEITLGVLDGMASELYGMYRQMQTLKSGVVGSGNGIRKNKHFVKIAEAKFGTAMKIPAHMEEAAVGAALFAAIACGIFKNAHEAQQLIRYI